MLLLLVIVVWLVLGLLGTYLLSVVEEELLTVGYLVEYWIVPVFGLFTFILSIVVLVCRTLCAIFSRLKKFLPKPDIKDIVLYDPDWLKRKKK